MNTIKIRLDIESLDNTVYSYNQVEQECGVEYVTASTVPDDSEVDEESPEYLKVCNLILTSTTGDDEVDVVGKYYKKVSGSETTYAYEEQTVKEPDKCYISGYTELPVASAITDIDDDYIYVSSWDIAFFKKYKYVTSEYLKLCIPVSNNHETNLYQEEMINDLFVNDIKANVIPDVIDMEKVVFTPAFENNGTVCDAKEIIFNLHFSNRLSESGWTVNESVNEWNGIPVGTVLTTQMLRTSDNLGFLGFEDDDVRFQTNKLKKSFLRVSFYTSKNPLEQKLLTYNTSFFDSGELYGKFMNNRVDVKDFGVNNNETPDSTNSNRLDSRITVVDKNNIDKSSEGFYIYLFNNEVTEKNPTKDIYMKVEFNHAKYGLTVPVGKPYIDFTTKQIRLMPFSEFFNSMFIKIKLKYIAEEKRFVYIVSEDGISTQIDEQNRRIIFNLFEVKFEE